MSSADDKLKDDARLLAQIKDQLPQLEKLLEEVNGHWCLEDGLYRFYHQSFKVCYLEQPTLRVVRALRRLWPGRPLNAWFREIIRDGTGTDPDDLPTAEPEPTVLGGPLPSFDHSWNAKWTKRTRPIVEAFMHARFMLEMAVKYGREMEEATGRLPSGWAALLYLYNAR